MEKRVVVYSTPTCPYCQKAKAYLDQRGIIYENVDISINQEATRKMINLSGQMGVPVIVVDNEVVVGFDKEKLEQLL